MSTPALPTVEDLLAEHDQDLASYIGELRGKREATKAIFVALSGITGIAVPLEDDAALQEAEKIIERSKSRRKSRRIGLPRRRSASPTQSTVPSPRL